MSIFFSLSFESVNTITSLYLLETDIGVYSTTITTRASLIDDYMSFNISAGDENDFVKFRAVLVEGDWTGLSEENNLDIINDAEFGSYRINY